MIPCTSIRLHAPLLTRPSLPLPYTPCPFPSPRSPAPSPSPSPALPLPHPSHQDGNGGHAQAFEDCSYGALRLNASAFRVVTVVVPNCVATCDFYGITMPSDTAAKVRTGQSHYLPRT